MSVSPKAVGSSAVQSSRPLDNCKAIPEVSIAVICDTAYSLYGRVRALRLNVACRDRDWIFLITIVLQWSGLFEEGRKLVEKPRKWQHPFDLDHAGRSKLDRTYSRLPSVLKWYLPGESAQIMVVALSTWTNPGLQHDQNSLPSIIRS